jgi:hypothetical protein
MVLSSPIVLPYLNTLFITEQTTPCIIQSRSVVNVPFALIAGPFEFPHLINALSEIALVDVNTFPKWSHTAHHLRLLTPGLVSC